MNLVFLRQKVNTNQTKIFHFNPTCEIAIANGSPYYVPPALLRDFESDLAPIMGVIANDCDFVICNNLPKKEFSDQLKQWGISTDKFITLNNLKELAENDPGRQFNLKSWGKSAAEANAFKFLNVVHPLWDDHLKTLFERKTSMEFLNHFFKRSGLPNNIDQNIQQQIVFNESEIEKLLEHNTPVVLKVPLSSSGRGLLVLRKETLNEANRQWIRGNIAQQDYLVASRWFNKQFDLSFQFEVDDEGNVSYLGYSVFMTNSNGQYNGHYLNFETKNHLPFDSNLINSIGTQLCEELIVSDFQKTHRGILGIDALIYLTDTGKYKIHPCIEINPRFTMGYLARQIEKKIHPQSFGQFKIFFDPKGGFKEFVAAEKKKNPPVLSDGFFQKGFLNITPADNYCKFGAYIKLL